MKVAPAAKAVEVAMHRAIEAKRVEASQHLISFEHHKRPLVPCCIRARCSCGWASDSYAQFSDTRRAIDVHLRRSRREDFDALIAQSSIGAALCDIEERGIDAHAADLSRAIRPRRRRNKSPRI